jgi:hypothetical protein
MAERQIGSMVEWECVERVKWRSGEMELKAKRGKLKAVEW